MSSRPQLEFRLQVPNLVAEVGTYFGFLYRYARLRGYQGFARFESVKDILVDLLYKQRGRYARPFLHVGTIGLIFAVIILGPLVLANSEETQVPPGQGGAVLLAQYGSSFATLQAEEVRQYRGGEITIHVVQEGETISSIAQRYGLQPNTILWENDLTEKTKLKPGQELKILPVDGVRHKVARGETLQSIGKKYGLEESELQKVVDYPFNVFLSDETFELATGQYLIVPEGVKPDPVKPAVVKTIAYTPDAGAVSGTGKFRWPAKGMITQRYSFYHKAIDIANRGGGPIVAADGGVVVGAGWLDNSGYGNRVIIDHGNGMVTLYAHMSVIQVQPGQRVNSGDVLGQMGSTGRSTGTHLHFEIRQGGVLLNPLQFLGST
jgi:murein DD-endopeptidase MepM/ murein hydrolase activator NlpD